MDTLARMREDWDRRARENAEHYIYTRDSDADLADFQASGEANYKQLIRPYLPILLDGKPARDARAVEIGCGVGRMTAWLARDFGSVDALDVSAEMIEGARRRLAAHSNLTLHVGNGRDLAPIADASADLVFSYIVFQHIPSRDVIESYVVEAARVLRQGGAFKFQVNGDQSPEYVSHARDTWFGETFSESEVLAMLARCGLSPLSLEGAGTQYFVITARKGADRLHRSYVLPGEPWAEPLLLEGFGPDVDRSWRPMNSRARVRLDGPGQRLYMGLYFWPDSCRHRVLLAGRPFDVDSPGDHYFECEPHVETAEVEIGIEPPPTHAPAFRVLGRY